MILPVMSNVSLFFRKRNGIKDLYVANAETLIIARGRNHSPADVQNAKVKNLLPHILYFTDAGFHCHPPLN
jgi:hypothetical protein